MEAWVQLGVLGSRGEDRVVADAIAVRPQNIEARVCSAGDLAADRGGQWEFVHRVRGWVVMRGKDEHVRIRCRHEADELVPDAVALEGWAIDEHFVDIGVVRLVGPVGIGGERDRDSGVPGRQVAGAADCLEVALDRQVVAEFDRGKTPRIRGDVGGRPVGIGAQNVTGAARVGLGEQRLSGVAIVVEVERVSKRTRQHTGDAQRVARREHLRVVDRVLREARVGAAIRAESTAESLLGSVGPSRIVQAHHDTEIGIIRDAIQSEETHGVVDVRHLAADQFSPLLQEHVAGDQVAVVDAVGCDGGNATLTAKIAGVGNRQAALACLDT